MALDRGAPKVQIETADAFGRPIVEQISLDTNRADLHVEFLFRYGNAIALPTRGLYTDAALWVLTVATILRVTYSAVRLGLLTSIIAEFLVYFAFLPLLVGMVAIVVQLPSHRPACLYRLILIALGFTLAIVDAP